jgi:hypothetical protein
MGFLATAAAELTFGDFCDGAFFYDAYIRADASALRERTVKGAFLQKEFQRDELTSYIPVDESVPALKQQEGTNFVLAHGVAFETAACLSDDCEITSRFGRDAGGPNGRLLFAPVTKLKEEEREALTATNWGRILLGEDVVEIRRSFMVDAADYVEGEDAGLVTRRSLDAAASVQLATWWSAYACRRGPLVDAVNLAKLEQIANASGYSDAEPLKAVLQELLAVAWTLQGGPIENAGAAYDDHRSDLGAIDFDQVLDAIRTQVFDLEKAVSAAANALR